MPNNHSKYSIPSGLRISSALVDLHRDHGGPGIHPPASLGGETLDLQAMAGKESVDSAARVLRPNSGKDSLPARGLQLEVGEGRRALDHVDHIYPVRQGRIEPVPYREPVPAPVPERITVSGRSFTPVGPVWISVPMAGQTPQS